MVLSYSSQFEYNTYLFIPLAKNDIETFQGQQRQPKTLEYVQICVAAINAMPAATQAGQRGGRAVEQFVLRFPSPLLI